MIRTGDSGLDQSLPSSAAFEHRVSLCWLRRDLRLADNPALHYACQHAARVVLAYVHAPEEEAPWQPGEASNWWLHRSLKSLAAELGQFKQRLVVRQGASLPTLQALIAESKASLVVWNRLYEPAVIARDTAIKAALQSDGIEVHSHNGSLLFEPWTVQTKLRTPFKVFTPFWRTCAAQLAQVRPLPTPKTLPSVDQPLATQTIESLKLEPKLSWAAGLASMWKPGERGAHEALEAFADRCERYRDARDRPAIAGTSRLSPFLHFGEISPRQAFAALAGKAHEARAAEGVDALLRQLGWREFAHHLLYHFPHTAQEPFNPKFAGLKWKKNSIALRAWQQGKTGIPLVDAGMRELWATGYMHNRVRMIAASLLTKNLNISWREGARWFWDTLVDADLANNSLGWQWVAGSGADAAPYYRIFNPVLQSERFDKEGVYLRRWLPELAQLSNKTIHAPWLSSNDELKSGGVILGKNYPKPVVDLAASRDDALQRYKALGELGAAPITDR
jgi:deoxyribodipyrimidine photo-lyase